MLYESPFASQLLVISDSNKRLVGTSDAFPETVSLGAGTFTVRAQVKHTSLSLLNGLKNMPLVLEHKLSKPVSVWVDGWLCLCAGSTG